LKSTKAAATDDKKALKNSKVLGDNTNGTKTIAQVGTGGAAILLRDRGYRTGRRRISH
jgi:hypothetical protein